ncbi:peptidoglycan-binding domain-containing protein [Paracraurococcus ruber]|uniref:Peptidoglycan binding-like domain-containing protein n=1 Tax=Paracraurococcus ruber TaxID=77675 RepID=A0ABS1CTF8_9PROT|nr:peptidoglycan-binding domain-containing protein [Paracraurococcus ruber]MBK1657773.1 hypothetical protein [Paracraurococcus ruber]TDG29563.1 hypothetical protein E2C05_17600 [Paracraurococcus ruber]
MRELSLGMSGVDVRRWERFLVRARTFDKAPTGFFSSDLAAATECYQRASGLEPTGGADAATLGLALQQGLLDRDLDEPANASEPVASKTSRWTVMGPVIVAAAAAVGTFFTSLGVEFVKYQSGLEAERAKLQNLLIQQALRVETSAGTAAWRNNEAQLEVVSRLRGYVRLGLIKMEPATLEAFLSDLGSVPVTRTTAAAVQATSTAPVSAPSPEPQAANTPRNGTIASAPPPVASYTQRVFIQFAGSIARDQIIRMARDLSAQWRVEGADRGGERIGTAAGLREVRWGHPDDETAAKALADAIERTGVIRGDVTAKRVPAVGRNTLEVWISP